MDTAINLLIELSTEYVAQTERTAGDEAVEVLK